MRPILIYCLALSALLLSALSFSAFQAVPSAAAAEKTAAFAVLQAKCNRCHRRQNPRRVFTLENMSDHATDIYEQVFVKGRMPRGRKIRLTAPEARALKRWLATELPLPQN